MSLSYLTTQGNRMPFIHKGSRLSPESYALSHQPHICQRSQQMQNILKIFETFLNSRELLAELKTIVNWQKLMPLEVGSEHIGIFVFVFMYKSFWKLWILGYMSLLPVSKNLWLHKMCQIWGCVRGLWWEKIHFDLYFLTPPSLLVTSCIQRAKRAASKNEAKFLLKKSDILSW